MRRTNGSVSRGRQQKKKKKVWNVCCVLCVRVNVNVNMVSNAKSEKRKGRREEWKKVNES